MECNSRMAQAIELIQIRRLELAKATAELQKLMEEIGRK
jgi:hypothetical protein